MHFHVLSKCWLPGADPELRVGTGMIEENSLEKEEIGYEKRKCLTAAGICKIQYITHKFLPVLLWQV